MLPACRPRARGGRGRDVRDRHQHQEGAEDSREDGHREARQGPRERHRREPRRRDSGPCRRPARRPRHPLHLARRHLRQVPQGRTGGLDRGGHGDRLRRVRLEARAGDIRGGHGVLRIVARLPAEAARPRRDRHRARRLRCPQGPGQGHRRGLPGRRMAALRGAPDARLHARGRLLAAQAPRRQDRLPGLPRQGRRHRRGHVPRGLRDAGGVLPEGGEGNGGGGGGRARVS